MKKTNFLVLLFLSFILWNCNSSNNRKNENLQQSNNSEIQITDEARNAVNNCPIIQGLDVSEDKKTILMKILSDPDPDPLNQSGIECSQNQHKCKWCNGNIYSKYYTLQDYLKLKFIDNIFGNSYAEAINKLFGDTNEEIVEGEFPSIINQLCRQFKNNDKYICIATSDFCSEKCKTEYGYSH